MSSPDETDHRKKFARQICPLREEAINLDLRSLTRDNRPLSFEIKGKAIHASRHFPAFMGSQESSPRLTN